MTCFTLGLITTVVGYLLGYHAGKRRVRTIVDNFIRYRTIESAHNVLTKACLPTLENLKARLQDV